MLPTVYLKGVFSLLLLLSPSKSAVDALSATIRYRHFDEFLIHMDKSQQTFITEEVIEESIIINESESSTTSTIRPLPIRTGAIRSKEMTCCMLGQLAGDKGYHCVAKFYAARLIFRNYNRAHNRKIESLRPRSSNYKSSEKLMRTFGQCVTRGVIFHKCCHLAALERDPESLQDTPRLVNMDRQNDKNRNRMRG